MKNMGNAKSIFMIDDDVNIGNMLEEALIKEGYQVLRAYSGTEALFVLERKKPDLILLDLMLPGLDGRELLSEIEGIPVIVVSARAETEDKVSLLLNGAADYVTKPFDTKELLARIAVQLRNFSPSGKISLLEFSDISLSADTHKATVCGLPVKLTKTEFAILKLLMSHPSQVITKSLLFSFFFFLKSSFLPFLICPSHFSGGLFYIYLVLFPEKSWKNNFPKNRKLSFVLGSQFKP